MGAICLYFSAALEHRCRRSVAIASSQSLKELFQAKPNKENFMLYFGLVAKNCCKTMELCKTKAKNGFINLEIGGYLAYTPWDTLLLQGGLGRPFFLRSYQNIRRRAARRAPVRMFPLRLIALPGHLQFWVLGEKKSAA